MKRIEAQIFEYKAKLELDDDITLINGDSGVGKTLLFNYFDRQSYNDENIHCFNAKYVEKLKMGSKSAMNAFADKLRTIKNSLIVIDNADIILDDALRKTITFDKYNSYLIFGRNVSGLWITENNIAKLIRDSKSKTLYLDYYFKDVNRKNDRIMDRR